MSPFFDVNALTLSDLDDAPRVAAEILRLLPETGVVVIDEAMTIRLLAGPVFARHGYSAKSAVGRSVCDVVTAETWHRARPVWEAAVLGTAQTLDWTTHDGRHDYWIHFAPLQVAGPGGFTGAMMVAQDITDRATARRHLERRVTQQAAVSHLGTMLLQGSSFSEIADVAATALASGLGAEFSAVLEVCSDGNLALRASAGAGETPAPPPVKPGGQRPAWEFIVESNQPMMINDLGSPGQLRAPVLEAAGVRSLVAAPASSAQGCFGLVGAASREPQAFTADDLAYAQAIANIVAQSVEGERAAQRARRAESRLESFWDMAIDLLGVFTVDAVFVEVSGSWERTLGWTPAELIGRRALDFVHPEDRAAAEKLAEDARRGVERPPEVSNRYRAKDGSYRWLLWSIKSAADGFLYAAGKDITTRRQAEERASQRLRLLDDAERLAATGSWELDLLTEGLALSENMRRLLSLPRTEVGANEVIQRIHPDDRKRVITALAAGRTGPPEDPGDFRVTHADGGVRVFSLTAERIQAQDGRASGLRGMVQDVTERRADEERLLFSEERFRKGFDGAPIGMSLVHATTGAFIRVNPAFCEMVGRTAVELSQLTYRDVTHPDDVDMGETALSHPDGPEAVVIEKRFLRPDRTIIWGSVNITRVASDDCKDDVLFAQTVNITELHMQEDALRRQLSEVSWIGEIRTALVEDRFELHAQPIVDLKTGRTLHHELLLRMRDKAGELVPPNEFLPTAERYGDIRDIDRWVIAHGTELAAAGMSVGINLSGTSLGDPGLITYIDDQLQRTGADPHRVIFEITETALLESAATAVQLGTGLRERGCRFALDDFGTGYGGFQYLKQLPLDFLKIDREFVRDALTQESDRLVISTVVSLARGFHLKTIAEGIEDAETLALMARMGVDQGQGFHIGRPAPAAQRPDRVRDPDQT